ncbi:helix-turn-helix transcriptional regulator [Aquella oligotrophica]|nr:hypothetical protein [Aquella oligotrophica]
MNKHLEKYIRHCEDFYSDTFMIVLDRDLIARFAGNQYLKVGNKNLQSVVGKHIHATALIPDENIQPSLKAFNKAITEGITVPVLIANLLHKIEDKIQVLGACISPIMEPNTRYVIGLRFEFCTIKIDTFFQILIKNAQPIVNNNLPHNDEFLTKREHQIAFLLFYCSSYVEIAEIISRFNQRIITEKTVRNIVSRYLYPKFNVSNKDSLLAKLQLHGYHNKIPNSLLSNRFIDLSR